MKCPGNELVDCQHFEPFGSAQGKPQTCAHCRHTGPDVEIAYEHIGGEIRMIPITECRNRIACWQRWKRNQLAQIRR